MTHEGALLLSADQTPLAERDLFAPVCSLVYFTVNSYMHIHECDCSSNRFDELAP